MKTIHMKKLREKGITLIALVITIVVLIILATVAIQLSLGNNGIFNRAKTAKEQYQNAQDYEEVKINEYSNQIDAYIDASDRHTNTRTETILLDTVKESGSTITFLNGKTINDFDEIAIVTSQDDVTGNRIGEFRYLKSTLKHAIQNQVSETPALQINAYGTFYINISNLTQNSFSFESNRMKINRIIGINY